MLPSKPASERPITGLGKHTFSGPLPELSLGGPKLLAIAADHEGRLFLFLTLLFGAHGFGRLPSASGQR